MGVVVHDGVGVKGSVGPLEARRAIVRPHDGEVAVNVFAAVASCHGHCGHRKETEKEWSDLPAICTYIVS